MQAAPHQHCLPNPWAPLICAHLIEFLLQQLQELLCRTTIQLQSFRDPQPWAGPHTPVQLLLSLLLLQKLGRVLQVLLL